MSLKPEPNLSDKIKKALGIPKRITLQDIKIILSRFKFVFVVYLLIWIFYIIFFILLSSYTEKLLDKVFGVGYGTGFSASLGEDLLFSAVLGFIITFISIIVSKQTPEEEEFERRVFAILNRTDLSMEPKRYFKDAIAHLLSYFETIDAELIVNDYSQEKQVFSIVSNRQHVIKNMCEDKPYSEIKAALSIEPGVEVAGRYGMIHSLETFNVVDNSIIKRFVDLAERKYIQQGVNTVDYSYEIPANSETGLRLSYEMWVEGPNEKNEESIYLGTSKFTRKFKLKITNRLPNKNTLLFTAKQFKLTLNREDVIKDKENVKVLFGENNYHEMIIGELHPGDRIKIFFNQTKD